MPSMPPSEKPPVSNVRRARSPSSRPSLRRAGGQLDDPGRRRVAHPEVLVAGQLDPDRAAEQERRRGRQRIGDEQLAAEPATERRAGDADAGDRQPEQARQLGARPERALGGAGQVQDAVAIELGHGDLRLDVALVDPARGEPALDDDIAGRKRRVDIAASEPVPPDDIGRHGLVRLNSSEPPPTAACCDSAGASGLVDLPVDPGQRRAGGHRPFEVDDGRERARSRRRRARRRPRRPRASRRRPARRAGRPTGSRPGRAAGRADRAPRR